MSKSETSGLYCLRLDLTLAVLESGSPLWQADIQTAAPRQRDVRPVEAELLRAGIAALQERLESCEGEGRPT
jgi:hypothetical protein